MADRMDPETRQRVTSAGGHARAEALSPERRSEIGRSAAAAINSPAALARRIIKAWPSLSRAERAEVRGILAPIMRVVGAPKTTARGRSTEAKP